LSFFVSDVKIGSGSDFFGPRHRALGTILKRQFFVSLKKLGQNPHPQSTWLAF